MSGKLRFYKDKLEGYNRFYSIVKTIKMVTLARFRASQARVRTRDYTLRYTEKAFWNSHLSESGPMAKSKDKAVYIPITTNRGSCGALNSSIVSMIEKIHSDQVTLMPVGKKGLDSLTKIFPRSCNWGIINDMKQPFHFAFATFVLENAKMISPDALEIRLLFHRFISTGIQRPSFYVIWGFERFLTDLNEAACSEKKHPQYNFANALLNEDDEMIKDFYDFHSALMTLNAINENELSEYAARITAVEGQLSNITMLRNNTAAIYNKTRQTGITASLMEIIAAMTSLEGNVGKGIKKIPFWNNKPTLRK